MNNEISPRMLQTSLDRVLDFMKERKISTPKDLDGILDSRHDITKTPQEFIEVKKRPGGMSSQPSSYVYTISYVKKGYGIILEVRVNSEENYSRFIVKMNNSISGYRKFAADRNGNVIQERVIQSVAIESVYQGLKDLKDRLFAFLN